MKIQRTILYTQLSIYAAPTFYYQNQINQLSSSSSWTYHLADLLIIKIIACDSKNKKLLL